MRERCGLRPGPHDLWQIAATVDDRLLLSPCRKKTRNVTNTNLYKVLTTLCLRKNALTLKRYSSKLLLPILMTFGKNIQNTLEYSLHASVFVQVCFFYELFVFQTGRRKWRIFWQLRLTVPVNMAPFSKEDKISTKSLYKCKGYSAWQFKTEFLDKGWTKNSINRLLVTLRKFGTVWRVIFVTSGDAI